MTGVFNLYTRMVYQTRLHRVARSSERTPEDVESGANVPSASRGKRAHDATELGWARHCESRARGSLVSHDASNLACSRFDRDVLARLYKDWIRFQNGAALNSCLDIALSKGINGCEQCDEKAALWVEVSCTCTACVCAMCTRLSCLDPGLVVPLVIRRQSLSSPPYREVSQCVVEH
jgi:hypothetical protein